MYIKAISIFAASLFAYFVDQLALASTVSNATAPALDSTTPSAAFSNIQEFKLRPRIAIWGFTGDNTLGEGQLILPFYGDSSAAFYSIAEGNLTANGNSWLGMGVGYRRAVYANIFGGYVSLDYDSVGTNKYFYIVNPGLEILGTFWDLHINGYLPFADKLTTEKTSWAGDGYDNYSYIRKAGHSYYDHLLQKTENAGRGFDLDVARTIPYVASAKLHLGAYHFDIKDSGSVNGIAARLTYDLGKYTAVELRDTYDNEHRNQFLIGIKLTFGGYNKEEQQALGISSRLTDQIEHNFASSTIVPIKQAYKDLGERLEHDNIWVYKPKDGELKADAFEDGTFEHPFKGFTQANYKTIDPKIGVADKYPLLFFAPGEYSLQEFTSRSLGGRFSLPDGWGMYGKDIDYGKPAIGDARAKFIGGIDLNYAAEAAKDSSDKKTILDSISISNNQGDVLNGAPALKDSKTNAALYINNAHDVLLQNTAIQNTVETNGLKTLGVYAENSKVTMNHSIIAAENAPNNGDADAVGMYAANSKLILAGENTILGKAVAGSSATQANAKSCGLYAAKTSIEINGNENKILGSALGGNVKGLNSDIEANAAAIGLYAQDSFIRITGNSNKILGIAQGGVADVATYNGDGKAYATASYVYGLTASNTAITIDGNKNIIQGVGLGGNAAIKNEGKDEQSPDIISYADATDIYGLYLLNNSPLLINGYSNQFLANGIGGNASANNKADGDSIKTIAEAKVSCLKGLSSYDSPITVSGNGNRFIAQGDGGHAKVDNEGSSIQNIGITARAQVTATDGLSASGGSTNIYGHNNTFSAKVTGGEGEAHNQGNADRINVAVDTDIYIINGLYAGASPVIVDGNNNIFSAQIMTGGKANARNEGNADFTNSAVSSAEVNGVFGLYSHASSITVSGNGNLMFSQGKGGTATAIGGDASTTADAYLIAAACAYDTGAIINITGNNNGFSSIAKGGLANGVRAKGDADGILAFSDATINFASTSMGTHVTVDGNTTSTAIHADDDTTHLQIDGIDKTDLAYFPRLITFIKNGSGGYKIRWGSNVLDW